MRISEFGSDLAWTRVRRDQRDRKIVRRDLHIKNRALPGVDAPRIMQQYSEYK
jgi:hypothetical protein